ncbi:hypothetical protein ILP97_19270 [Amycolatopsis sp. H6(2020)]|nr:hypothetical protein [Amycolatopsis sp. H6(2020)]
MASGPVVPVVVLVLLAAGVALWCTAAGRCWVGRARSVAAATLAAFRPALPAPGRAGLAVGGNLLVTAAAVRGHGPASCRCPAGRAAPR